MFRIDPKSLAGKWERYPNKVISLRFSVDMDLEGDTVQPLSSPHGGWRMGLWDPKSHFPI